ncbi:MAG: bis(5'-nucleosyl)-tetraphosphatase (symmetrical) YqeK [Clostridia bacterium]|nr:bis(5'-nucleosyl)-tetraphosphatase (symmetrical) YqeK [Clostridia bacterium]
MTIDQMREKLKTALTEKRFNHSLGVMETAVQMAKHFGADVQKTAVAALLHDCAKNYSKAEMFELCDRFGVLLDDICKASTGLIHGFLGAEIANKYYGVSDPEIYDAIYYHTIGKPNMSLMTKIIYIADGIEPARHYEGVDLIREMVYEDIDRALILQIDYTIRSVISRGALIHTNTIDTRNFYLKKIR